MINFFDYRFEPDATYWVSAIGNKTEYKGEESFDVVLYKLKDGIDPYNFDPLNHQQIEGGNINIQIGIESIRYLGAGMFIHKNQLISNYKTSKEFQIENLDYLSGKGNWDNFYRKLKDFYLKKTKDKEGKTIYFPLNIPFAHHGNMQCLWMKDEKTKTINVIPCIEVIRYFFCESEGMVKTIFKEFIEDSDFYNPQRSTSKEDFKASGEFFLLLRKQIPGSSSLIVSYIAYLEEWTNSALEIWESIYNHKMSMDQYLNNTGQSKDRYKIGYPRCSFPFGNQTYVDTNGIDLGISEHGEFEGYNIYLVNNIISCDYQFPNLKGRFDQENNNSSADTKNAKPRKKSQVEIPTKKLDSLDISLEDLPNSKKTTGILTSNQIPSNFSDGLGKDLVKITKEEQKTYAPRVKIINKTEDGYAINDTNESKSTNGRGQARKRPMDNRHIENERILENQKRGHEQLINRLLIEKDYSLMNTQGEYYISFPLEYVPNKKRSLGRSTRIYNKEKERYQWKGIREVLYLKIKYKNQYCFDLIDVLVRTGCSDKPGSIYLIAAKDFSKIDDEDYKKLLIHFCKKGSTIIRSRDFKKHYFKTISHYEDLNQTYKIIKRKIEKDCE